MTQSKIDRSTVNGSWAEIFFIPMDEEMRPFSWFWRILYMHDEIIHEYRYYRRKKDD